MRPPRTGVIVRHNSYRNLLWIIALLGFSWVSAPAQAPKPTQAQGLIGHFISRVQQEIAKSNAIETHTASPAGVSPAAQPYGVAPPGSQVEKASVIPDSTSLLPVAAVVGFSFLLGGIVCGA